MVVGPFAARRLRYCAMREVTTEAVLFDLDGTLLDTIDDLAACMNAALAECGLPGAPVADHKLMVGDGVAEYVRRAMPSERCGDEDLAGRITEIYQGLYKTGCTERTRPYEGIPAMLAQLAGRGLRLAVLSNKPDRFTREMKALSKLQHRGIVPFLEAGMDCEQKPYILMPYIQGKDLRGV